MYRGHMGRGQGSRLSQGDGELERLRTRGQVPLLWGRVKYTRKWHEGISWAYVNVRRSKSGRGRRGTYHSAVPSSWAGCSPDVHWDTEASGNRNI